MKWLLVPLLWALAALVAVAVLYRLWRGKPVLLRGRFTPAFVRMVVVVLIVVGIGVEKTEGRAPVPATKSDDRDDALPTTVTAKTLDAWLRLQVPDDAYAWGSFKLAYLEATRQTPAHARALLGNLKDGSYHPPKPFADIVGKDLAARADGKEPPRVAARDLLAALDALEQGGFYDHWANAYLWRRLSAGVEDGDRKQLAEVFARLERHARVVNTLVKANAHVKPLLMPPRAWASKAGPSKAMIDRQKQAVADVLAAAQELYSRCDAGTWLQDGSVQLRLPKEAGPLTLVQAGKSRGVGETETVRLGRLDLLRTGEKATKVEHAWLGEIDLPADRVLSVWDLSGCLSDDAAKQVKREIASALYDDSKEAARRLERAMPFAHKLLREELTESPKAKGSARMRLILSLFDESVIPMTTPQIAEEDGGGIGGPGSPGRR